MIVKHLDFVGLRKDGRPITEKEIHQKRTASVKSTLNTGALFTMMQYIMRRRSWFLKCGRMKEGAILFMLSCLSGTLITCINQTRGQRVPSNKVCSGCGCDLQTNIHLVSECSSKGLRTTRHYALYNGTVQQLKCQHPDRELHFECSWRASNNSEGCLY